MELVLDDLSEKEIVLLDDYARLEEDFATECVNYEEQICVLPDRVHKLYIHTAI